MAVQVNVKMTAEQFDAVRTHLSRYLDVLTKEESECYNNDDNAIRGDAIFALRQSVVESLEVFL